MNNYNEIIELDNTLVQLQATDLDGDGVIGGVETIKRKFDSGTIDVKQETELVGVMKTVFPESNANSTKMLGNMTSIEENYSLAFLLLARMGVIPSLGRDLVLEKILLGVSRNARGRDDAVNLTTGKREQDAKIAGGGAKGFFGMGGQ